MTVLFIIGEVVVVIGDIRGGDGSKNPLHIGDIVEIDYVETPFKYRYIWISNMDKFNGMTTRVKEVFDDEYVRLEDCCSNNHYYLFHYEWLDKINKEELEEVVLEDEDLRLFLGDFIK